MTRSELTRSCVTERGGYVADALAQFAVAADAADMPDGAAMLLGRNIIDSVGCAVAARDGETVAGCVIRWRPSAARVARR